MLVTVKMYNIQNYIIWWQIHIFLFHGNSNVCFISHHLRDVCKNKYNAYILTLKMNLKKEKNRTYAFDWKCPIYICDFLQNFSYPARYVYTKRYTHTHTHTQTHAYTNTQSHIHSYTHTLIHTYAHILLLLLLLCNFILRSNVIIKSCNDETWIGGTGESLVRHKIDETETFSASYEIIW